VVATRPARSGPAAETAPQVFVEDLDSPVVAAEDRHHLERSRRLRPGDEVVCADGVGGWRRCRFGPTVEPVSGIERVARPSPVLTVGFALVKGNRPELIVAKLTELGIDRIVPVSADRSVVRWDPDRAAGHLDRLQRVAREAAMQSRRAWLPEVLGVASVVALAQSAPGAGVALAEPGGDPPTLAHPTVLVGPEGGWTDGELAQVETRVGLNAQVLRVETAAITVGALLAALRSGLVEPPPHVVARERRARV
jgi:16S rRNA (uracil1498-N3)-methyltransferase